MCDSCGCTPCSACGAPLEDGARAGCGEKPDDCTCEPLDEESDYEDEDDYDHGDDEDEDEHW